MGKFVKKIWVLALLCAFAAAPAVAQTTTPSTGTAPSTSPVAASQGQMLHDANGGRLGSVDRVTSDGSVQIILDGRVVTIPVSTLSITDGELNTSLTKHQVMDLGK